MAATSGAAEEEEEMEVVVEAPAVAPDVAAKLSERAREQINLRVVTQRGEEIFFKVKGSTKFGKLIEAFCEKKGLRSSQQRFVFDGNRIHANQTPAQLEMEDGDVIDVYTEATGGCGRANRD